MKQLRELISKSRARKKAGCFVAEGLRMVSETPADRIEELYVSQSFMKSAGNLKDLPLYLGSAQIVEDRIFRAVSDTMNPQGILAVVRMEEHSASDIISARSPLVLMLENIQDPGNLGTMIRTAEGAGAAGIILSRETADIYNPKTVRSSMGSLYRMKIAYADDICAAEEQLKAAGIEVYAATLEGSVPYTSPDYRKPCAFLIGNERSGLTSGAVDAAGRRVRIPMAGKLESLNAASAAAVLLYEAARQRQLPGA